MHIPVAPKTRTRKWPESEDASCDLNSSKISFCKDKNYHHRHNPTDNLQERWLQQ